MKNHNQFCRLRPKNAGAFVGLKMRKSTISQLLACIHWTLVMVILNFVLLTLAPCDGKAGEFWLEIFRSKANLILAFWVCSAYWPSLLFVVPLMVIPFEMNIPLVAGKVGRSRRCKFILWLWIALIALTWMPSLISLPTEIFDIFKYFEAPVFNAHSGLGCVCDRSLAERLDFVLLPALISALAFLALGPGWRNFLHVFKLSPGWLLKLVGPPIKFYPRTCLYLFLCLFVVDVWIRYSTVKEYLWQGFH